MLPIHTGAESSSLVVVEVKVQKLNWHVYEQKFIIHTDYHCF